MRECNKNNNVVVCSFLIALGIIYCTLNMYYAISSFLISLSFVYVFSVFISKCSHGDIKRINITILLLSFLLVFLNTSLSGFSEVSGFDYYKKAIMYLATIVWIVCSISTKISKRTSILILILNLIINCLYLIFFQKGFSVFEGEFLLTLNFTNPNQAGMFLLNSILYLGISIAAGIDLVGNRKRYICLLCILIPMFIAICNLLLMTGCRSSFMSLSFFLVLVALEYISKGHFRLKKWMSLAISILPFIFVFAYLSYVNDFSLDVSMGVENAGKSSETRIPIWEPIVDNFWHYLIIGDYYGISDGTGMSQLHNTHLDIYASYGITTLILYIIILYNAICTSIKNANSRFQRVSLYAFISCIISCMFEASFVSGSAGLFLLTIGFLILANSDFSGNLVNSSSAIHAN